MTKQQSGWIGIKSACAKGLLGLLVSLAMGVTPARAVVTYGGTGQSLVPNSGPVTTEGFQYEGTWQGAYLGTVISPDAFITATHLSGSVGNTFVYDGTNYTTIASYADPNSPDLTVWKVSGTFSQYAPLYTGNEVGQSMVVYGNSGPRRQVDINGTTYGGYYFGNVPLGTSYGTNSVTYAGSLPGTTGQFIAFQFNPALGALTSSLAPGDSGGGVFIQQNGQWALAGVNYAVDGPYNIHAANDPNYKASDAFSGAIYDGTGLYINGDSTPLSGPSSSYSSRISTESQWIDQAAGIPVIVPEPSAWVLLIGGMMLAGPVVVRRKRAGRLAA